MAADNTPYSPRRAFATNAVYLVAMNSFLIYLGERRVALGIDLFLLLFAALIVLATRIWPDKIWFRRPGEPRYSDLPHTKPKQG